MNGDARTWILILAASEGPSLLREAVRREGILEEADPQRVADALHHMPASRTGRAEDTDFAHWSLAARHARLNGCTL